MTSSIEQGPAVLDIGQHAIPHPTPNRIWTTEMNDYWRAVEIQENRRRGLFVKVGGIQQILGSDHSGPSPDEHPETAENFSALRHMVKLLSCRYSGDESRDGLKGWWPRNHTFKVSAQMNALHSTPDIIKHYATLWGKELGIPPSMHMDYSMTFAFLIASLHSKQVDVAKKIIREKKLKMRFYDNTTEALVGETRYGTNDYFDLENNVVTHYWHDSIPTGPTSVPSTPAATGLVKPDPLTSAGEIPEHQIIELDSSDEETAADLWRPVNGDQRLLIRHDRRAVSVEEEEASKDEAPAPPALRWSVTVSSSTPAQSDYMIAFQLPGEDSISIVEPLADVFNLEDDKIEAAFFRYVSGGLKPPARVMKDIYYTLNTFHPKLGVLSSKATQFHSLVAYAPQLARLNHGCAIFGVHVNASTETKPDHASQHRIPQATIAKERSRPLSSSAKTTTVATAGHALQGGNARSTTLAKRKAVENPEATYKPVGRRRRTGRGTLDHDL